MTRVGRTCRSVRDNSHCVGGELALRGRELALRGRELALRVGELAPRAGQLDVRGIPRAGGGAGDAVRVLSQASRGQQSESQCVRSHRTCGFRDAA